MILRSIVLTPRKKLLLSLVIIAITGILSKMIHINTMPWINNSLGGSLYVVFFIFLVLFAFPGWRPLYVSFTVFALTSVLEITQILKYPFLEKIRATFIGHSLIGSTFNPLDFLWYLGGAIVALILIKLLF